MENNNIVLQNSHEEQKFYAVQCRCGHVGINHYVKIVFAVIANSRKEAAKKARKFARVKHDKKNAIIDCHQITRDEYDKILLANKNDPYLKCKNIQEQRSIDGFESRILEEPISINPKKSKIERKEFVRYKLKKQRLLIEALNISIALSI